MNSGLLAGLGPKNALWSLNALLNIAFWPLGRPGLEQCIFELERLAKTSYVGLLANLGPKSTFSLVKALD